MQHCVLRVLTAIIACVLSGHALADPPEQLVNALPWADISGDGVPEEIRLRAVVRNGVNGFDFGVWNPVSDQYYGDIARAPQSPNMAGYRFSVGPDLDGDGLPELWVADPSAREFVNGRGCVYVHSWRQSEPIMRLRGPGTDTLGTDLRIEVLNGGASYRVMVASQFQDIFGHVYERWNEFSTTGALVSTADPATATLVLRSGDVDKNLSTDPNDVAKVYQKAADLMGQFGITGQKHDEDLDGDDFVDAADILKVLDAVGVPEPSAASLTESAVYNIAPQRGLSRCGVCTIITACCLQGNCTCVRYSIPPNQLPKGGSSQPGWWTPQGTLPGGGTVLPPGAYPDRRPTRDSNTPRSACDGFRILPGDIEPGGIMVPAVMGTGDTVTARIENPSVAQFSADDQGNPLPTVAGGDIQLRGALTNDQINRARGHIKVYGLTPGETAIIVEITTHNASGGTETVEIREPVKVGGRIEAQVKRVRRWQPPSDWRNAAAAGYAGRAAADTATPVPYAPTSQVTWPSSLKGYSESGGSIGLNPDIDAPSSNGEEADKVLVFDACGDPIQKPMRFFTKRLLIGTDIDGDGVSEPDETMDSGLFELNNANIEAAIAGGKGPFANPNLRESSVRAYANPGSEMVAVVVGHAAERLAKLYGAETTNVAPQNRVMRTYFYPKIFGDLIFNQPPSQQSPAPDFERWSVQGDAGTGKYIPAYHRFNGQASLFGRDFAPAETPTTVNGVQQQYITGATFPVPIMNSLLYEALERNFGRTEVIGQGTLYDPNNPAGVPTTFQFNQWMAFSWPSFSDPIHITSHQQARDWFNAVHSNSVLQDYYNMSGIQHPEFVTPMTQEEFQAFIEAQVDPTEVWCKRGIFWAEIGLGFVPCGDVFGILYHGGMWALGVEVDENRIDFLMSCVGLAADLGYVGAAAGVVSNGAVAAVRIAFKYIEKIDHGATLKLLLKVGPDALKSIKKIIQYAMKYRPQWLASVNLGSPGEVFAAARRFATEVGELLSNTYTRMRKSKIAGKLEGMFDSTGLPVLVREYEDAIKSVNQVLLDRISRKSVSAEAAEGWYVAARLGDTPDIDRAVVKLRGALDRGSDAAIEAADDAVGRVGEALRKTMDVPESAAIDPHFVRAAQDAASNVMRQADDHLRSLVTSNVGVGRAFATMEEFEALRVLPIDKLAAEQAAALRSIRMQVIPVGAGTPVVKVMSEQDAIARLAASDATFSGFFAKQAELSGADSSEAVIKRLRTDYNGSPFTEGGSYVRLDTVANSDIAAKTGVPMHPSIAGTPPPPGIHIRSDGPPFTGNGFTGSIDGHLTPESLVPRASPATCTPGVTVMSFKNADGSPKVISMGQGGASDRWVLQARDPQDLTRGYFWEALP